MQRKHGQKSEATEQEPKPPANPSASTRYDNLKFHAAGGLGEVYRATDESLRRDVALKFIQDRHAKNPEYLELFFLEAEITSRLDHPGVVPVYGVGQTAEHRPFYSMRFIEGAPLREAIAHFHNNKAASGELHRLINHLVSVCNTVAYAHNRGVVHCDIKPENIMLGKFGETLLVDWGLATTVERDERARASGEQTMRVKSGNPSGKSSGGAAGTVGYMSPEQHPGFLKPIRPASDIYSLGATLYCILTNQAPLHGAEETLLLDKLRYAEFPPPSHVNAQTPRALEAICMKAMAAHPAERYSSAQDMAADLEAWLADEPVSVYRERLGERLIRWIRRHRTWVVSGLLAATVVLLVASGSAVMLGKTAKREAVARADAEQASKEAETARRNAVLAQQNGMRLAARFAAQAVANEIDRRWRILTEVARDPELQRLMLAVEDKTKDSPQRRELQRWIEARKKADAPRADSWFLTDENGVQIARDPLNEKSLFNNFSRRNYFHGGAKDLEATESSGPISPIARPHFSTVYMSTASRSLKVAFSVPIWKDSDPESKCLGVLGMSVELGEFAELQTGLDAGQIAVLVDTRDDQAEGSPKSGLILHHPSLQEAERRRTSDGNNALFRVSPQIVEKLNRLRELRTRGEMSGNLADTMELEYKDPVAPEGSPAVMAAFEPVRVDTGSRDVHDTGWAVIVQETPLEAKPTATH